MGFSLENSKLQDDLEQNIVLCTNSPILYLCFIQCKALVYYTSYVLSLEPVRSALNQGQACDFLITGWDALQLTTGWHLEGIISFTSVVAFNALASSNFGIICFCSCSLLCNNSSSSPRRSSRFCLFAWET